MVVVVVVVVDDDDVAQGGCADRHMWYNTHKILISVSRIAAVEIQMQQRYLIAPR